MKFVFSLLLALPLFSFADETLQLSKSDLDRLPTGCKIRNGSVRCNGTVKGAKLSEARRLNNRWKKEGKLGQPAPQERLAFGANFDSNRGALLDLGCRDRGASAMPYCGSLKKGDKKKASKIQSRMRQAAIGADVPVSSATKTSNGKKKASNKFTSWSRARDEDELDKLLKKSDTLSVRKTKYLDKIVRQKKLIERNAKAMGCDWEDGELTGEKCRPDAEQYKKYRNNIDKFQDSIAGYRQKIEELETEVVGARKGQEEALEEAAQVIAGKSTPASKTCKGKKGEEWAKCRLELRAQQGNAATKGSGGTSSASSSSSSGSAATPSGSAASSGTATSGSSSAATSDSPAAPTSPAADLGPATEEEKKAAKSGAVAIAKNIIRLREAEIELDAARDETGNALRDLETTLDKLENKMDSSAFGLYIQDKLGQFVNSDYFCRANKLAPATCDKKPKKKVEAKYIDSLFPKRRAKK